ncbi:MAG: hypothetical protein SCH98_03520 [Deferrisomatales bacterium]|nr:hypothetical protein [Deferrisomatales bacterium]
MKRLLRTALVGTLALGLAAPAFADHEIGGYFRTQFIMASQGVSAGWGAPVVPGAGLVTKDEKPDKMVDNRLRIRWQNNINEYVSIVWFGEIDTPWGQPSKGAIGSGGRQGMDGVNVETKHAYADVKIPDTPVSFRVGGQGWGGAFNGVVMNDDMMGVRANVKLDMVSTTLFWAKLLENDRFREDDKDLYSVQVGLTPIKGLKITPELTWIRDQPGDRDDFFAGIELAHKIANIDVSGWFLYNWGTDESGPADVDTQAFAASAKVATQIAGVKASLRLMYFSNDDDAKDDKSINPGGRDGGAAFSNGGFEFFDEYLQIFLTDIYYNNWIGGRRALLDAAYSGFGLFGAVAGGTYVPPAVKALTLRGAVGYFMALDDERNDSAAAADNREGTSLGTEISVSVGYKIAGNAELNLRGAYALLGDFYDGQAAGGRDPDDLYITVLMLNIPY